MSVSMSQYRSVPDVDAPPRIRSRVAPDIDPLGGGIVDDTQAAETHPASSPSRSRSNSTSPRPGSPAPKMGFLRSILGRRRVSQ